MGPIYETNPKGLPGGKAFRSLLCLCLAGENAENGGPAAGHHGASGASPPQFPHNRGQIRVLLEHHSFKVVFQWELFQAAASQIPGNGLKLSQNRRASWGSQRIRNIAV
jgi:hypothetical protein